MLTGRRRPASPPGRGIAGQRVRVERRDDDGGLAVYYCWKRFRDLSHDQLVKGKIL